MFREVLSRAKRTDNREWVEGYHFKSWGCRNGVKYVSHFIHAYEEDVQYEIDPETLCEYTGLDDKDRCKIWEHDIVTYDDSPYSVYCEPRTGEIVWRNGCLCFKFLLYGSVTYKSFLSDDFFAMKCTVIGNSIDMPDLVGTVYYKEQ